MEVRMRTSELALAAYLQIKGHKIEEIINENGQAFFIFKDNDGIKKDVVEYSNSDFARFESAIRALRKIVYTMVKTR